MMVMFDIFRSIIFMVVLCGFWCCGVKGAQTSWDYVQGGTLTAFFEENLVSKGVSFLRSPEGCERVFTHTQKTVDEALTVRETEEELRGPAEERFNADAAFISGWCTRFQDVLDWADNVVSNMNDKERLFMRILCYLRIIDNDKSLFSSKEKPKRLSIGIANLFAFFASGPVYKFFVKKEGGLSFGLLEGLLAMAQGQSLFVVRKYWSDKEKAIIHGSEGTPYSNFAHDQSHAHYQKQMLVALNSFKEDLYQEFTKAIITVIKNDWPTKGLEYTIGAFSMLHEKNLYRILMTEESDLHEKIKGCLTRGVSDPGYFPLVEGLLPKGYCEDTITDAEKKEELTKVLMQWEIEVLAKVSFCWRGADTVVRAQEARKTLQCSWSLQSCSEWYVNISLVQEVVASLLKRDFPKKEAVRRQIARYIGNISLMGQEAPSFILLHKPDYTFSYGHGRDYMPLPTLDNLSQWSSCGRRVFLKCLLSHIMQYFLDNRSRRSMETWVERLDFEHWYF